MKEVRYNIEGVRYRGSEVTARTGTWFGVSNNNNKELQDREQQDMI